MEQEKFIVCVVPKKELSSRHSIPKTSLIKLRNEKWGAKYVSCDGEEVVDLDWTGCRPHRLKSPEIEVTHILTLRSANRKLYKFCADAGKMRMNFAYTRELGI